MTQKQWTNKKVDKFVVVNSRLGQGAFGVVYRGFQVDDESQQVAAKAIEIKRISDCDKMLQLIKREISILQKVNSMYIVRLLDVARTTHNLYMFLEYCADGDLKEYLKQKQGGFLSETEASLFYRHIVEGFRELYYKSIIHRDIKPANIMLHNGIAKIADFGFSRMLETGMDDPAFISRLGSPLYMSPQILEGAMFSSKCDVWSVGVVFYEMLYGKTPWTGDSQTSLLQNVRDKPLKFPEYPPRSNKVKNIIRNMLKYKEDERPSWEEVFKYDLIQEGVQQQPENIFGATNNGSSTGLNTSGTGSMTGGTGTSGTGAGKDGTNSSNVVLKDDPFAGTMVKVQKYIDKNLVVGYLDMIEEDEKTKDNGSMSSNGGSLSMTPIQKSDMNAKEENIINKFIKQEETKDKIRKNVLKVNQYMLYERNISTFFTYFGIKLYKARMYGKIKLEQDLYARTIYITLQNGIVNLTRVEYILKQEKSDVFKGEETWKRYLKSNQKEKTSRIVERDIQELKSLVADITPKVKELLTAAENKYSDLQKQNNVLSFQQVINEQFDVDDKHMHNAYKVTIRELSNCIQTLSLDQASDRELIVLARYITTALDPYEDFKTLEFDFNQFYEAVQSSSNEQLINYVKEKLL